MTLIAAFKQNDVPILLGDFLLTGFDDTWGTRKKSHLISKNFVVAWTGSRLAASTVLRELNSQFREQNVTRAGVEDFFTNYDTSQLGALEVHLVGWIIDDGPHCFLWNNLYPHELFYDSSHVDGSGAPASKRLLKRKLESRGSVGDSKIKQAIFYSLSKYATLIGHEIVGLNHQLHFGFGFELLYFDG